MSRRLFLAAWCLAFLGRAVEIEAAEAVRYTVTIADPASKLADIEALIPTKNGGSVQLMMPIWSPGFYRVEDYAGKVRDLKATTQAGEPLKVLQTKANEWTVEAGKERRIVVSYRLLCDRRSVTTNEIAATYAVFNPAGMFVIPRAVLKDPKAEIEVRLSVPAEWDSASALPAASGPHSFRAQNYETLVDSPILTGVLSRHSFTVDGTVHELVDAGELGEWDGARGAEDMQKFVAETERFFGFLPFKRYLFLNVFRQGGGGLEHKDSTLLTSSAARMAPRRAYVGWLGFVSHEYFHAFNVKRLRPLELGPFDFDHPPSTPSLWISEGLTTYFAELMVRRSGLSTPLEFLEGLSTQIASLQKQPGRLLQTVEQSSREVWSNSNSGVGQNDATVSYYVKGDVIGFVLDARIRRATDGQKSIDEVLRRAYKKYSGKRGFTPIEFETIASEVAGVDLSSWFQKAARSTEELDYAEALEWFGLRFADTSDPTKRWNLIIREDATPDQATHLADWLKGRPGR